MNGYEVDFSILFRDPYRELLLEGFLLTLQLAGLSLGFAFILGVPIGIARLVRGPVGAITFWYVEFLRTTPALVHVLLWYFAGSILLPRPIYEWLLDNNLRFWVVVIAISIYASAFIAEIVRGGIQAIPKGQVDAGKATGLSPWQIGRYVQFPQVVRIIAPALLNEIVSILKATSLGVVIGVPELLYQAKYIQDTTFRVVEAYAAVGVGYLLLGLTIGSLAKLLSRKYEVDH